MKYTKIKILNSFLRIHFVVTSDSQDLTHALLIPLGKLQKNADQISISKLLLVIGVNGLEGK
jgi:hypothetical protein